MSSTHPPIPAHRLADARPHPFGLEQIRPAVLTIDLHRGHLDPEVATLPLPADIAARVVSAAAAFLGRAREAGLPIVHVVTRYRDREEISRNPFWRSIADTGVTRSNVLRHNLEDLPGVQLMPGILDPSHDRVVDTKKRYDCFLATDLAFILDGLGVNTLLIAGVNTNSCVLATTIAASVRDYACIVLADCVNTVDGQDFHQSALACIECAFGWVMTGDEALAAVQPALARSP